MPTRETYPVEIAGLKRDLRLFEVAPGLRIAILNILGDTELVQACAKELNKKLKDVDYDVLVTAEAKSIPLAFSLSVEAKKPYAILRKTYKPTNLIWATRSRLRRCPSPPVSRKF